MSDMSPSGWHGDDEEGVVRATHDRGGGRSLSSSIVAAIAELRGLDPVEVEPPLHTVVDTDALDSLFARADSDDLFIVFSYADAEVTVWGDDRILVREADD
jgi:hypothetical protein